MRRDTHLLNISVRISASIFATVIGVGPLLLLPPKKLMFNRQARVWFAKVCWLSLLRDSPLGPLFTFMRCGVQMLSAKRNLLLCIRLQNKSVNSNNWRIQRAALYGKIQPDFILKPIHICLFFCLTTMSAILEREDKNLVESGLANSVTVESSVEESYPVRVQRAADNLVTAKTQLNGDMKLLCTEIDGIYKIASEFSKDARRLERAVESIPVLEDWVAEKVSAIDQLKSQIIFLHKVMDED